MQVVVYQKVSEYRNTGHERKNLSVYAKTMITGDIESYMKEFKSMVILDSPTFFGCFALYPNQFYRKEYNHEYTIAYN